MMSTDAISLLCGLTLLVPLWTLPHAGRARGGATVTAELVAERNTRLQESPQSAGECPASARIPGRSYYDEFRATILQKDLPKRLGVGDGDDQSWTKAVLALTLFTESRLENSNSIATTSFSILRRAGFGSANFMIGCIARAAVNSDYSQWQLTRQIKHNQTPSWLMRQCGASNDCIAKNALIIENPAAYAETYRAKYRFPEKLSFAGKFSSCLIDRLASPSRDSQLGVILEFGRFFSQPTLIYSEGVYRDHAAYLEDPRLSYCPNGTSRGYCTDPAHFNKTLKQGAGLAMHYYSLSTPHSREEIGQLSDRVDSLVASCR